MEINYQDLGLKVQHGTKSFEFNGQQIEIVNYLSAKDKYDLVMGTLEKSEEEFYYNDVKLEMYYHLHLIMVYTNIIFSSEDRQDEGELYDELCSSGFMDKFLENFDKKVYADTFKLIVSLGKTISESKRSAGATVQNVITNLPINAEKTAEIIKNLDTEKLKNLQTTAESLMKEKNLM